MQTIQELGAFFQDRRIRSDLSSIEATSLLNLPSPKLLADYEEGRTPIPLDLIFQMTNLFNIDPDELVERFYFLVYSPCVNSGNYST